MTFESAKKEPYFNITVKLKGKLHFNTLKERLLM